jgi:fumarate reductase subunit C
MRELTSLPVAWSCILIILYIRALNEGPESYYDFIDTLSSPVMIVINILAFAGLVFHSLTWFDLAPKAMVIKIGRHRVPGPIIAWMNYSGWLMISVVIFWILK